MTPAEIAKYRLAAQSRSSRDLAEKLVRKYTERLTILNGKGSLSISERRERDELRGLVVALA